MNLPTIGMFWDGPPLGFIERLCITSFRDAGHPVVLFSYGKLDGVPHGIQTATATDILPNPDDIVRHELSGSPAPHADKFRYHLLAQNDGMIWSDTDAYCIKPFLPTDGYFFCRESDKVVANGVMAIPATSQTLKDLIAVCDDEYFIPTWLMPRRVAEMKERAEAGNPMHVSEMPWGAWGPKAFTHFLKKNDEFRRALEPHVLYPLLFEHRKIYFLSAWKTWRRVQDDTVSIHFFGRRVRARLWNRFNGVPPEGCVLDELGKKHGVKLDAAQPV